MKHKFPWRKHFVSIDGRKGWDVVDANNWCVAERMNKETANLLVAAPELLEALKELTSISQTVLAIPNVSELETAFPYKDNPYVGLRESVQSAHAAIAKATGE